LENNKCVVLFFVVPDMAYILEVERYLQPRGVVPKV